MTSVEDFTAQADALLEADLSEAHADVQSLAATYRSRQGDRRAYVFARALVKRARATGLEVGTGRGGRVTKADLLAEVERRNAGRGDADKIPGTSKSTVAELQAALDADDKA